ncbi:MAG: DsbA family protein [Bauldia sp.]|nr:DsbA family protein [Bauldia sp.]
MRHKRSGGFLAMASAAFAAFIVLAAPASAQNRINEMELAVEGPLGDVVLGAADAPVTIIEYASMTCPHCANFHNTTFDALKTEYIDTGKVRFIMREFPLDPLSAAGFMLARCAPGENGYYGMVDLLFETQGEWIVSEPIPPLFALASQSGFTQESFEACLTNQEILDGVYAVYDRAAQQFAVDVTPTFFINGVRYTGSRPIEDMRAIIDPLL